MAVRFGNSAKDTDMHYFLLVSWSKYIFIRLRLPISSASCIEKNNKVVDEGRTLRYRRK